MTIRIVDIDTPETHRSRCENELVLGLKAKERLRALLDGGTVSFKPIGTDRYGRTLARVYAGEVDVGQRLLEEGHALHYIPGAESQGQATCRVVRVMTNGKATIIALIVAIAFFNFTLVYKPWISIAFVIVVTWLGFRWLIRNHPMVAVALIGFLRGLLGSRS